MIRFETESTNCIPLVLRLLHDPCNPCNIAISQYHVALLNWTFLVHVHLIQVLNKLKPHILSQYKSLSHSLPTVPLQVNHTSNTPSYSKPVNHHPLVIWIKTNSLKPKLYTVSASLPLISTSYSKATIIEKWQVMNEEISKLLKIGKRTSVLWDSTPNMARYK